jgi:hypothetical protein
MIAHRFRPVFWVVGCAVAATALYTVSLGVASERTRLEDLDHKIAMTRRDIRQLQTELGTRASLRQLERWNGDVLALSAPKAGQFRATETALKTIDGSTLPTDSFAPPPVMVAAATRTATPMESTAAQPAPAKVAVAQPKVTVVKTASAEQAVRKVVAAQKADKLAADKPILTDKRPTTKAQRFAMLDRALVDKRTFGEILVRAEAESRTGGKGKSAQ